MLLPSATPSSLYSQHLLLNTFSSLPFHTEHSGYVAIVDTQEHVGKRAMMGWWSGLGGKRWELHHCTDGLQHFIAGMPLPPSLTAPGQGANCSPPFALHLPPCVLVCFFYTFILDILLPLSQIPSPSVASPVLAGKQSIFSADRSSKITQN